MSDTFPDETLYPVLESLADEDRIFASNSAAGHESSQIKGSTIKGLINALKGTPPATLNTLAKLAAAINNDPAFHSTLTTALGLKAPLASPALTGTPTAPTAAAGTNTTQLATTAFVTGAVAGKQDASNAMTTDTAQEITAVKTFRVPFQNLPTGTANYNAFSIGAAGSLTWYLQFKPSTKELNWFTTKGGQYPVPLSLVYDPDPRAVFPISPTVPTATASDNSTLAASTAFVQAQKASPALTGTPTAPTAAAGTNTTQIATTAFVTGAVAGKAPLASPALTGTPTAPTAAAGTNTTQIATTAFCAAALAGKAPLASPALTGKPTAPTAAAGTNTTQLATTAFVQAALAGAAGIPAGVICMWSGTIATVPSGWALCDGTNGTPDLVDRFVVAAGSTAGGDKYDPGDTGGADDVTLALSQIPSHQHSGTTGSAGQHRHAAYVPFWGGSAGSSTMIDKRDSAAYKEDQPEQLIYTDYSLDHTHTFTTDSKGGGGSHENRPPYYALAFIMKL